MAVTGKYRLKVGQFKELSGIFSQDFETPDELNNLVLDISNPDRLTGFDTSTANLDAIFEFERFHIWDELNLEGVAEVIVDVYDGGTSEYQYDLVPVIELE